MQKLQTICGIHNSKIYFSCIITPCSEQLPPSLPHQTTTYVDNIERYVTE